MQGDTTMVVAVARMKWAGQEPQGMTTTTMRRSLSTARCRWFACPGRPSGPACTINADRVLAFWRWPGFGKEPSQRWKDMMDIRQWPYAKTLLRAPLICLYSRVRRWYLVRQIASMLRSLASAFIDTGAAV